MKLKFNKISKKVIFAIGILYGINIGSFYLNDISYANNDVYDIEIVNNFGGSSQDRFFSIKQASDGGFVAVGQSSSTNAGFVHKGDRDAIIVKYNSDGTQQWIKSFGGSGTDEFYRVNQVSDGGFVCVGYSTSTNAGFNNKGMYDAIIVKYDSDGNQEWFKNWGGSYPEFFRWIIPTSDGGFMCVGDSESSNAGFTNKGSYDAIIVKFDSNGTQQWVKNFGGSKHDKFHSITQISDGGFICAGNSESTNAGFTSKGAKDAIVVKYDSNGTQQWVKNFGGSSADEFHGITPTLDGGFVCVGYSESTNAGFTSKGARDAIIVKYDSNGTQQWVKNFGGSALDNFIELTQTSDGGFACVGYSESTNAGFTNKGSTDAVMVKYDSNGVQQWVESFGDSKADYFRSVIETPNKDLIVVGYSESTNAGFNNKGSEDSIIVKYREKSLAEIAVENATQTLEQEDIEYARNLVNKLPEGDKKEELQNILNAIVPNIAFESKNTTANVDVYIKSQNMLLMSLSTNSISFDEYSGVDEVEKQNAVEMSINSSLPYDLNAYLLDEMYNSDRTKKIDIDRLQIKDNEDTDYKEFANINEKLVLKDSCESGNDKSHSIDLKLKGGNAYESEIYKTVIKFEAKQK